MALPWFRMYAEAVDDDKLRLLAFEDRWHFVALLCLKSQGTLDERNEPLRRQKIGVKLGLDSVELETVMKRLVTIGLVTSKWQPINWNKRQFLSDSSTKRVQAFRERSRNVSVTPPDTDTDTDTDSEKDIRARESFDAVMAAYPKTANRNDPILAERSCLYLIENGSTWSELLASAKRYAAQCDALQRTGTQYVIAAHKHFSGNTWRDEFPIPPDKAQRNQDANISASLKWLEDSDAGK